MKRIMNCCAVSAACGALLLLVGAAKADTPITTFDNFASDDLYASWVSPPSVIVSGPTSYSITATGYGSNYKYIGFPEIMGAGNTDIELTVTLSGPPEADGQLGPIIELIDADGTDYNFAWYGQPLGSHVLTLPVESPTWSNNPGSIAGLDLNTLTHMHMQLDPGGFGTSGAYTVEWENLSLINTVPEPGTLLLITCCGLLWGTRRQ